MSTPKVFLLICVLSALMISCEWEYVKENNKVYLKGWNEGNGDFKYEVPGSDAASFQTIETDGGSLMGKDKFHVYHEATIIENADPATFVFLGNYYYRDADSLYYFGSYNNVNECEVENVSPEGFELLDDFPWARAGKHIINRQSSSYLSDIETFEAIDENWGKTQSRILWSGHIVEGADVVSFEVIDSYQGKDKYHTYYGGKLKE